MSVMAAMDAERIASSRWNCSLPSYMPLAMPIQPSNAAWSIWPPSNIGLISVGRSL